MKQNTTAYLSAIEDLTLEVRHAMFQLMYKYYEGVTESDFNNDLSNKTDCILIYANQDIIGFSTLTTLKSKRIEQSICVYSGDTVVDAEYWGQQHLVHLWCEYLNRVKSTNDNMNVYWLLTSKGIKTYRFLPLYFKEYYPSDLNCSQDSHNTLKICLDTYAREIYGDLYDSRTHLIHHEGQAQRLKNIQNLASVDSYKKRGAGYFYAKNPDWGEGVELASLVQVNHANLTKAGLRAFSRCNHNEYIKSA